MAAPEHLGDKGGNVRAGNVVHRDAFYAAFGQSAGQDVDRVLRVSVHGGVQQSHCLFLRFISAPAVVFIQQPNQIAAPHHAVKGADHTDVQPGKLFERILHLRSVFADDISIIAPGVRQPILLKPYLVVKQVAA